MLYSDGLGKQAYLPTTADKEKRGAWCTRTRDGRIHINCQAAATLTHGKLAFIVVIALVLLAYILAPVLGFSDESSLRRRVRELEHAMGQKVSWVLTHQKHIRKHLASGSSSEGAPAWSDGRRHLWSQPDGVSRLAEALAPNTGLADFDDHYLCGENDITEEEVIRKKIALAAVTWRAPLSLRNAMESWRRGGLLDIVDERMLFINSPTQEDYDIAKEYEFDVYITDEHNGNIMAGPSIAYLVGNSTADYILFMEKDFVLSADRATTMREMYTGIQHLARGVDVYRLRGKTDHPAEGMPDCCMQSDPPQCPYNSAWKSGGYFSDHMNWLFIFCDPNIMEHSNGRLAYCTREPNAPDAYCFTSGETNWSNNPVLFPKQWFDERIREIAFRDWEHNNLFEFNVMMDWLSWRPPAKAYFAVIGSTIQYLQSDIDNMAGTDQDLSKKFDTAIAGDKRALQHGDFSAGLGGVRQGWRDPAVRAPGDLHAREQHALDTAQRVEALYDAQDNRQPLAGAARPVVGGSTDAQGHGLEVPARGGEFPAAASLG